MKSKVQYLNSQCEDDVNFPNIDRGNPTKSKADPNSNPTTKDYIKLIRFRPTLKQRSDSKGISNGEPPTKRFKFIDCTVDAKKAVER